MYLLEKRIKKLRIKNIIFILMAAANILVSGSYIISEFVYYRDDLETAMNAVSMKSAIRGVMTRQRRLSGFSSAMTRVGT